MASDDFRFKQFTVRHDRCAMKVGTDGVLLGAWTPIDTAASVLDIGTGSGLVALICAQRSAASITAIEIDAEAAAQARQNAAASPWNLRINVHHCSLEEFAASTQQRFDRIVVNPPFFENSFKASGDRRNLARHADTLPFDHLIVLSAQLLAEDGIFSCILPVSEEESFPKRAKLSGLFCSHMLRVLPREEAPAKRVILCFKKNPSDAVISTLAILKKDSDAPTDQYRELTKELYLNF